MHCLRSIISSTLHAAIRTWRSRLVGVRKFTRDRILQNPKLKWYRRIVWLCSLSWAAVLAIQSVPFYQAIGAGETAFNDANYPEAERQFKIAVAESHNFRAGDLRRAKAANNLAELYRMTGRYTDAEQLLEQAVELSRRLGKNRQEYPLSLANLAALYRDMGRYSQAEFTYCEALAVWDRRVKNADDLKRAAIINGLGKVYRDEGRAQDAIEKYMQALSIKETQLGNNDVGIVDVLENLGGINRDIGRFTVAENYYKRGLDIDLIGRANPLIIAIDRNNLAGLWREEGKLDLATQQYQWVLDVRERLLGPDHPLVAKTLCGLSDVSMQQGDLDRAQQLLVRALEIQSRSIGKDHPDFATTLELLGSLSLRRQRLSLAYDYFSRSLAIREKSLPENHPDIGLSQLHLAQTYLASGNSEKASASFSLANTSLARLNPEHPARRQLLTVGKALAGDLKARGAGST